MTEITTTENTAELQLRLDRLLDDGAEALGHPFNPQAVGFEARENDGTFLGGIYGWGQLGWFFVKLLALAPEARKRGVGGKLLEKAEAHARSEGLSGVYLDTYVFQAPEFYAKMGYEEIGRLPAVGDHPQRVWFAKTLGEVRS